MTIGAKLAVIGFDADDTLWQNERFFRLSQDRFESLLADFADKDHLAERLLAAERRNLGHYGYGVKGFTLSMIETAIEITEDRVPARVIRELIEIGQDLLAHPIELLPHAQSTVETLAHSHKILLITKGDLLDQERKLAQSGLGDLFAGVEIVSEKTAATYGAIFGGSPALMAGNSLKSDVIPAIEAGAWGVHIPHDLTWALEHAEAPTTAERYRTLETLEHLPALVEEIESTA
ncbi:MAG: HAD family hydrolase [Pseudomonadota bacterium]